MNNMFILIILIVTLMLVSLTAVGIWVYKDAKQRGIPAGMWVLLVVLSSNFIGLILYLLIGRKQETFICDDCGATNNVQSQYCSACGKEINMKAVTVKSSKGLLIIGLFCIVLVFISLGLFIFSDINAEGFTFERQMGLYSYGSQGYAKKVNQSSSSNTWDLSFDEVDKGYIFKKTYNAESQTLSLSSDFVFDGSIQLKVTQNDIIIDEIMTEGNYSFDMSEFETGKIKFEIVCIDASDFSGSIKIKTE